MMYDQKNHHRESIRLKEYDYSKPGGYFITIVTKNRVCLFGNVVDGEMLLNEAGKTVNECWRAIPEHFPQVTLDGFIVMPNHIHGIIIIDEMHNVRDHVGVQNLEPLHYDKQNKYQNIIPKSIGSIVRGFKIGVTKWFRINTTIYNVWQRNYYEHIIRNRDDLHEIREYIANNPLKWEFDDENPDNMK